MALQQQGAQGGSGPDWSLLPKEIVEALGGYLDSKDWSNCRASSRLFSHITHAITLLEIDLEKDAHRWMMVLTCVARLFPRLTSVALLCGSRITPAIFAERMAALSITSIQLQELEVRFLYLSNPRLGSWLEDLQGVTELRGLKLLRLAGGATPTPAFFEGLLALKQLRVLEVLPGVYGQIVGYDMDVGQADADSHPVGHMGVGDAHLAAIGKLTQLQHVTVKVCPRETTPAGLCSLTALGLLDSLQHLALYDAELPCETLSQHLSGASLLTSLQFGLSSVSRELSALRSLPNLKAIGLDTAFLPSLDELVWTARSAKIPQQGPSSITSLCLLDQTVANSQQLASLSQLHSLEELVLVNPLMQQPQTPAAAPPSPAAEHQQHQHQQQQQQQLPIDLAALSGLGNLRLLQIDSGLRGAGSGADMQPLPLLLTEEAVQALSGAWTALETLDLSGLGPDMLPEAALTGLSRFSNLRALSVMHPDGSPHLAEGEDDADFDAEPPLLQGLAAAVAPLPAAAAGGAGAGAAGGAAGGGGSSSGSDASKLRGLPWWHLPEGLMSLCLSHMDLTGRGSSQCCGELCSGDGSSSGGGGDGSSSSCMCCLAPIAAGGQQQQQQQQQLLRLGLGLFQARSSPLRPLSKRRRQTQQRTDQSDPQNAAAGSGGGAGGAAAGASSSSGGLEQCFDRAGGDCSAAAEGEGAAEDAAQALPALCSCATVLPARFSTLQALWFEQVTLPPSFMPRVLPALSTRLESLALLHVTGTQPEDMASLSSVTALTSLRFIPSDHDVGGLEPLTGMKHLKKLNLKLTHLRPSDLTILSKMRSLFCLSLSAPCVNGELYPGFASAVRLQQVEDVVRSSLHYCDVELQAEPDMTAVP